jgi:hypothetical protein
MCRADDAMERGERIASRRARIAFAVVRSNENRKWFVANGASGEGRV